MQNIRLRAISIVLLLASFFTVRIAAQGCDLLLRDGVFNTFNQTSGSYSYGSWHQAWCSGTVTQSSGGSSSGASLNLGFTSISLGIGFNDAQQFQTMYKQQFCGSNSNTSVNLENEASFQKTADPGLMSAYVQCRRVETKGLETQFNESPNHQVFVITMRYNQQFEGTNKPRVKSVSFVPATAVNCTGTIKPPMLLDANSNSLQCERKVSTPVSVMINTDLGPFSRDLPAVTPPPSDQELVMAALPQGTILAWAAKAPVPKGWHLCDGSSGTPNLVGRYEVGTDDAAKVSTFTGSETHKHHGTGEAHANISKYAWGPGFQFEQEGNETRNHSHPVDIDTDLQPNAPLSTYVQFIMKL